MPSPPSRHIRRRIFPLRVAYFYKCNFKIVLLGVMTSWYERHLQLIKTHPLGSNGPTIIGTLLDGE